MLVFPFPSPAKAEPVRGTFAVAYSPNGILRRPTSFLQRPAHPPRKVAFCPAPYSIAWGAESGGPPPATTPLAQFQSYLPTVAQAASAYVESSDPRIQVRVYEQKIRNYEQMKRTPPYNVVPGVLWYDNEIAKMRAKLAAARENLALAHEGEQATRQWRSLGQASIGVSIVAGVAVVTLLVAMTAQTTRRR